MSHVDDGTLHAYLDGALDEYPTAEAERVREHLDVCPECRGRLEAERAIKDQAASILSATVPRVDVPSLEELRSYVRAKAPRTSTGSSHLHRLGWAASIAVALGTGWMLGGGRLDPSDRVVDVGPVGEGATTAGVERFPPAPATPSGGDDSARSADGPSTGLTPAPAASRPGGDALLPSRTPLPRVSVDAASVESAVESDPLGSDEVVADLGSPPPLPPAPRLEDTIGLKVMSSDLLVETTDSGRNADSSRERTASPTRVATSASAAAPSPGIDASSPALKVGDLPDPPREEVAEEEESYSLVVPGLPVLVVRFRGSGVRSEGQVALQRLESGDTLTVIHLPKEIELSSLEAPPVTDRQIAVQTASGWIVMRAPLLEDGLLDLMRRLLSAN